MKLIKTSEYLRFKEMEKQLVLLSGCLDELQGKYNNLCYEYEILDECYKDTLSDLVKTEDRNKELSHKLTSCYARIGGFTKGRNKRNARGSK